MEEPIKLSGVTLSDKLSEMGLRTGWVEKHAELIAKLEAEYQSSHDEKDDSLDTRYYGFRVGNLNLLISEEMSSEILEDSTINPILLAPNWLIGVCNVRGDIVPIIDLEQIVTSKIGITEPRKYKTLILSQEGNSIGLLLAKLPVSIYFNKEERVSNYSKLPELIQPFTTIAYERKQNIWTCLDFSTFISSFSN